MKLVEKIIENNITEMPENKYSPEFNKLILKLIEKNESLRPSAREVFKKYFISH